MKIFRNRILGIVLAGFVLAGCASGQERQGVKTGGGVGAALGAATGLALGAMTGEAGFAAAGAAAGAIAGGAAGSMYMYDQSRDDRRTKMLADSIGGAKKGESADDAGKRHLQDFTGDWNLSIWALKADGTKISATGKAKAVVSGKDTLEIQFSDIKSPDVDQTLSGTSVLTASPESGFSLENRFSATSETRKFVGEYVPADNAYNFYPSTNEEGETITGVIRSQIRISLRVSGTNIVTADTFSLVDGKETQIQSYRFTR